MGAGDWGLGAGKQRGKPVPTTPLPTPVPERARAPIYFLAPHRLRGEASLRRKKASRHYAYLPTPVFWGVGGERSETEGGGFRRKLKNGAQ